MKLGTIAASALLGATAFASTASAQGDVTTMEVSRMSQPGSMGESSRMAAPGPAPELEPARPAAGMLPEPRGPMRPAAGEAANVPRQGHDIRNTLRRE
jgi:hypothetical protein